MASISFPDPISKGEDGDQNASFSGGREASEAAVTGDQVRFRGGVKRVVGIRERACTAKDRISVLPPCVAGKRSSIYRGVTRHRWTGRYEAHLWDKSTWNQSQNKKGKQVYLGAYDDEEAAARAYDLAALKYWGPGTLTNFKVTDYARDVEEMSGFSREEYLVSLRRKSSILARGISKFCGISRWETSLADRVAATNCLDYHYDDELCGKGLKVNGGRVDLTRYIKWWGVGPTTASPEETHCTSSEDTAAGTGPPNLNAAEPTSPYRLPRLGIQRSPGSSPGSAMAVLNSSPAYRILQERVSKMEEAEAEESEKNNPNEPSRFIPRPEFPISSQFVYSSPERQQHQLLADGTDDILDPVFWSSFILPSEALEDGPGSMYTLFQGE